MGLLIDTIHWWNSRILPVLGFMANFCFLWLVLYRTPKEMQKHSRILLQTCALDIIFLAISTIGIPLELESNGIWLFLLDGILFDQFYALFGNLGGIMFMPIYFGLYMIEILCVSVQFVYRYLLLNHNLHIGFCRYLLCLSIPIVVSFASNVYLFIYLFPLIEVHSKNVQEFLEVFDLNERKYYFTINSNFNEFNRILFGNVALNLLVAYGIVIFCGVKMVKFMNAHSGFSENTKRLNKQLTKTLIILSILPFILTFCGLLAILNFLFVSKNSATANNLIAQGIGNQTFILLPVLNPLVGIATNTPYRNVAMFWRKRKIETKTAVEVVQNGFINN